jgi:hypothetical protein
LAEGLGGFDDACRWLSREFLAAIEAEELIFAV